MRLHAGPATTAAAAAAAPCTLVHPRTNRHPIVRCAGRRPELPPFDRTVRRGSAPSPRRSGGAARRTRSRPRQDVTAARAAARARATAPGLEAAQAGTALVLKLATMTFMTHVTVDLSGRAHMEVEGAGHHVHELLNRRAAAQAPLIAFFWRWD